MDGEANEPNEKDGVLDVAVDNKEDFGDAGAAFLRGASAN